MVVSKKKFTRIINRLYRQDITREKDKARNLGYDVYAWIVYRKPQIRQNYSDFLRKAEVQLFNQMR